MRIYCEWFIVDLLLNELTFAIYAMQRACRTSQATNREAAQPLIQYIATFAKYFIPIQLVGAGEIGKQGLGLSASTMTE